MNDKAQLTEKLSDVDFWKQKYFDLLDKYERVKQNASLKNHDILVLNEKIKQMEIKTGIKTETVNSGELITLKDYFNRFYSIRSEVQSDYEAWQTIEQEYEGKYGRHNYSNYGSFVNAKTRYIKSGGKWDRFKSTK